MGKKKTLGQGKLWGSWLGLPTREEPIVIPVPALTPGFGLALHKCAGKCGAQPLPSLYLSFLGEGTGGHRADVAAALSAWLFFWLVTLKQTEN